MRKLTRILEQVHDRPWLITPGAYAAVERVVHSALAEGVPSSLWTGDATGTAGVGYAIDSKTGLASLEVSGTLGNRLSMIEKMCGGCDYGELEGAIQGAVEDGARGLLLTFDSPGGMCNGCPELAEVIAAVPLPKVAFTDSILASAAYWLASSCDAIVATPSALVGSIGVVLPWVDSSRSFANMGLVNQALLSPDSSLKVAGAPGTSLSSEQRAYLQAHVNAMYAGFTGFVSRYRSIDFAALAGGTYSGPRALHANLVDRIGSLGLAARLLEDLVDKAA